MQPTAPQVAAQGFKRADLAGIKVLVVDHEPDARELIALMLTTYGADPITASTADEALALLERVPRTSRSAMSGCDRVVDK